MPISSVTSSRDGALAIHAAMPPGLGANHSLTLTHTHQGGRSFSTRAAFSYAPPTIARTTALATAGGEIVIFGDNFGAVSSDPACIALLETTQLFRPTAND